MSACTKRECLDNECPRCLGLGRVLADVWQGTQVTKQCPSCGGTGRKRGVPPENKER
jgi:hypothetical protein